MHVPVMLQQVLDALQVRASGVYVDATFGRGGHSRAILEKLGPEGRLIALDRDAQAIAVGKELAAEDARFTIVHSPFSELAQVIEELGLAGNIDGVLLDVGVSSPQLDTAERGFSFQQDGPLDMRMDTSTGMTAAEWLAHSSVDTIIQVLRRYGEERFARRIAAAIDEARTEQPITTTLQLVDIIKQAVPYYEPNKHPATRTFQALRVVVNDELTQLEHALQGALAILKPGGRLAVLSFHSLEHKVVKRFMKTYLPGNDDAVAADGTPLPVRATKLKRCGKAMTATQQELKDNPRARSAMLRVVETCDE